ncbi:MAG: hypothetical protein HY553_21500 [Elusimicrobia bacterium]|nr:hypothetical protein [Elusimicrobiota bacterium]
MNAPMIRAWSLAALLAYAPAAALEPWPAPHARDADEVRRELRRAYAGANPELPVEEPRPEWLEASLRDAVAAAKKPRAKSIRKGPRKRSAERARRSRKTNASPGK